MMECVNKNVSIKNVTLTVMIVIIYQVEDVL